jgi:tetratricopeptide (TPR) repeat protein
MDLWNRLRLRNAGGKYPVGARTALFFFNNYAAKRNALGLDAENQGDALMAKVKNKVNARDYLKAQQAYGLAYQDYAWAQEWYPLEPKYAYNVGNALVHLGRDQEALDYYAKAWNLEPKDAEAYFNASVAAFHLGQTQRAGGYLSRVLALNPDYPQARENLDYLTKSGLYHP